MCEYEYRDLHIILVEKLPVKHVLYFKFVDSLALCFIAKLLSV